ncbi:hypothetical protein EVAR_42453_1 [Eumeta japonica]|uniref:Uncharacterized protein n=1 Tax=Eumeta variegata TaxID=151549 RepID=A0A4C1Y118_EUMVA|nr:hypothetical protein EVAR_42453_1 [Eumeta japonica]
MEPEGKHRNSIMKHRILAVFGLVEIVLRCTLTMNDFQGLMMQLEGRRMDVSVHLSYSSDLAPSGHCLLRPLKGSQGQSDHIGEQGTVRVLEFGWAAWRGRARQRDLVAQRGGCENETFLECAFPTCLDPPTTFRSFDRLTSAPIDSRRTR